MAQITWRNVSGSGGGGSAVNQAQANGVDTIMKAFRPLENIVQNETTRSDVNFDAGADLNTQAMEAQIRQSQDIGEFNQAVDEGQFSKENFTKLFGVQYNPENRQKVIDEQRGILQQKGLAAITPNALAQADDQRDLGAARSYIEQEMTSAGFKPPAIQQATNDFMTKNVAREKEYAKANKSDVDTFLANAPTVKSPQQAQALEAEAQKAGIKDLDYLRERASQELNDTYMFDKYRWEGARNAREAGRYGMEVSTYNRLEKERAAKDAAYRKVPEMLHDGATPSQVFNGLSNTIPGDEVPKFLSTISSMYRETGVLTDPQERELERITAKSTQQYTQHAAKLDAKNTEYVKAREDKTGITEPILNAVAEAAKLPGGIIEKIISSTSDKGGSELSDIFPGVDLGSNGIENQLNSFRDEISTKFTDISPTETDAIILLAYQDSDKISKMGNRGLNAASMRDNLQKRITSFQEGEAIEQERLKFQSAANAEKQTLQNNILDKDYANLRSVQTYNRTGDAGDKVKYIRDLDKDTFKVPKNYGVLGVYAKRKSDALAAQKDIATKKAAADLIRAAEAKKTKVSTAKETPFDLGKYAEKYDDAVANGMTPTASFSLGGFIGEKLQPKNAKYNRTGEDSLTALLRKQGVEADSLQERKKIVGGMKLEYPDATDKELLELLQKTFNK